MAPKNKRKKQRKRTKMVRITTPKIRQKINNKQEGGLGDFPQQEGNMRGSNEVLTVILQSCSP